MKRSVLVAVSAWYPEASVWITENESGIKNCIVRQNFVRCSNINPCLLVVIEMHFNKCYSFWGCNHVYLGGNVPRV
jgi:hypothetical protein